LRFLRPLARCILSALILGTLPGCASTYALLERRGVTVAAERESDGTTVIEVTGVKENPVVTAARPLASVGNTLIAAYACLGIFLLGENGKLGISAVGTTLGSRDFWIAAGIGALGADFFDRLAVEKMMGPPGTIIAERADGTSFYVSARQATLQRSGFGRWGTAVADPKREISVVYLLAANNTVVATARIENGKVEFERQVDSGSREETPGKRRASPALLVAVAFDSETKDHVLRAGTNGLVTVKVLNQGKGLAQGVRVRLTAENPSTSLQFPSDVEVGDLQPGEGRTVQAKLQASSGIQTGQVALRAVVEDDGGYDAPPVRLVFQSRAYERVRLAVDKAVAVENADGASTVRRGEELELKARIDNVCGTPARNVEAELVINDAKIVPVSSLKQSLGEILPGKSVVSSFSIVVANGYTGPKELPLSLRVKEARGEGNVEVPVKLVLDEDAPRVAEVFVDSSETPTQVKEQRPELTDPVDTAPTRHQPQPNAHAVIVGIERYKNALVPAVSFARRDAAVVQSYVTKTLGVPPEHVRVLLDHEASLAELRTAIAGQLANAVDGPNARVYVYFAGHGAPNLKTRQPYVVPYDGNPAYPETSCYPLAEMYETLAKLKAPVTVILDACFSGATGRGDVPGTLVADARPAFVELKGTSAPANLTVLAAADGEQVSSAFTSKRHGLFTYFVLKGLGGEADTDRNGHLTVQELHEFVLPQVQKQARRLNREQTPTLQGAGGTLY
jgi:hypothetical protein